MPAFPDREDERVRFGREPAGLEEREYLRDLFAWAVDPNTFEPGACDWIRREAWGESGAAPEDGDA